MSSIREFSETAEKIAAAYDEEVEAACKEFAARIEEARQNRRGQMNQALADFRGDDGSCADTVSGEYQPQHGHNHR
jgi:hypothetical protein